MGICLDSDTSYRKGHHGEAGFRENTALRTGIRPRPISRGIFSRTSNQSQLDGTVPTVCPQTPCSVALSVQLFHCNLLCWAISSIRTVSSRSKHPALAASIPQYHCTALSIAHSVSAYSLNSLLSSPLLPELPFQGFPNPSPSKLCVYAIYNRVTLTKIPTICYAPAFFAPCVQLFLFIP